MVPLPSPGSPWSQLSNKKILVENWLLRKWEWRVGVGLWENGWGMMGVESQPSQPQGKLPKARHLLPETGF